jgi:nucleobase:cation symporter-1, NCS1 family
MKGSFFVSLTAPVEKTERNLCGMDFFLLWTGAAISLGEIWAGGLLAPMGLLGGLLAILLGHIIGNTPMALGGVIGSRHGVPSMVSTRGALGIRGSYLPAALNAIQLVGWTAVMLWICGHAAAGLTAQCSWLGPRSWIVISGILTTVWALSGRRVWKWLQRIAVFLLIALSAVMTYAVLKHHGISALLSVKPTGTMPFVQGLDIVIAMPISWLPLVSDYSRFAIDTRRSFWGTWWGYLLAGSWMYAVGLCAALASSTETPDSMVVNLMASMSLAGPAVVIVLLSTITTTFLDIYSNAISIESIFPKLNERAVILACGILGTVVAVFFPAAEYQEFLLFIGAMFCPLFGIVLADYFILKRMQYVAGELFVGTLYRYAHGFNIPALVAWGCGIALYRLAAHAGWTCGASVPSMVGAGLFYLLLKRSLKRGAKGDAE